MSTSSPINPYEPPQSGPGVRPDFGDREEAELTDLRRRVQELESRVNRSWLVHRNVFLRILAIWGYLLLGYAILWAIVGTVIFIVWLASGHWLS
jgi:hypothetical protein